MASSTTTAAGSNKKHGNLRRMLRRCSLRSSEERESPEDVPRGHFAVYVGACRSRHVVPVACLAAPQFQELLRRAEEEFGFGHASGITLPCDEATFHAVLASSFRRSMA